MSATNGVVFQMSTAATAPERGVRLRDPRDGVGEEMEAHAGVVDRAEDVVVHPLPHLGRDHGRDGPGHEHDRPHHAPALEVRVDDERDDRSRGRTRRRP